MAYQHWKKKLITYINRDDMDHTNGVIDPFKYYGMFFKLATAYNLMDNDEKFTWKRILPICTVISGLTAGTFFVISLVHYFITFEVHLITEAGTYLITMIYKLLIRYVVSRGKKHYQGLLEALREDFHYIASRGQKHREKFFENQKLTHKGCVFACFFLGIFGTGMISCAGIAVLVVVIRDVPGSKRPLPYPMWLFDYDIQASPVYEFLFLLSLYFTVAHTTQLIFLTQSHLVWIRQSTTRADIIRWTLGDMMHDIKPARNNEEKEYYKLLIRHRMSEVVTMHHKMYKLIDGYADTVKLCLLYEQVMAGPVITLTSYVFAEKFEEGEFRLILMLLCVGTVGMIFVPCYLCTHLLEKVQSVGDACWDMPFWNAGPVIGPYLVLMMNMSMRPLPLVAPGFEDISLETYSRMLTRAYSLFNMLRQADFDLS